MTISSTRFTPTLPALCASAATIALAACGSGLESELRTRFVEKYDRPLCVSFGKPFPIVASPVGMSEHEQWLNALLEAEVVAARPLARRAGHFGDALMPRAEFTLTDTGQRAFDAVKGLCYGRAEIVEVIDYTEPSSVNGVPTVKAEARLRRRIDADWAKHPAFAQLINPGDEKVSMLLVKKAKGGWSPAY